MPHKLKMIQAATSVITMCEQGSVRATAHHTMVDDLFRSVFNDDDDAAARLDQPYGFDRFATPWS